MNRTIDIRRCSFDSICSIQMRRSCERKEKKRSMRFRFIQMSLVFTTEMITNFVWLFGSDLIFDESLSFAFCFSVMLT
jgi:hypothetical protein